MLRFQGDRAPPALLSPLFPSDLARASSHEPAIEHSDWPCRVLPGTNEAQSQSVVKPDPILCTFGEPPFAAREATAVSQTLFPPARALALLLIGINSPDKQKKQKGLGSLYKIRGRQKSRALFLFRQSAILFLLLVFFIFFPSSLLACLFIFFVFTSFTSIFSPSTLRLPLRLRLFFSTDLLCYGQFTTAATMLFSSLVVLPVLASTVTALGSNYTVPPDFNAGAISPEEKANWCEAEANTCNDVCGSYLINRCDPVKLYSLLFLYFYSRVSTLEFSCQCQNGTVPQIDQYKNSLPWFICQATFSQCIKAHPDDADGQQVCKDNQEKCGKLDATPPGDSSTTSASSEPTASSTGSSPSATTTGPAPTHTNAAAIMAAKDYSLGIFATVVLGVFGILL
ncbi:conserved hypothetical protein [Trichophyton verrucosum HKI 0517]|uniref:DUF7707 domain-containing protein n=1 Tax=Trichophyton verrucosum (strain HKI 0517) TaxID=663202 RepID=D4D128_TRIVH|nr:uncharacterized protein TRV_00774 [Trichophyton verrucosum HKI 0517]EFE44505.1 conserved hypothetical protein [Trichophyton verrucosum HKI 0517]